MEMRYLVHIENSVTSKLFNFRTREKNILHSIVLQILADYRILPLKYGSYFSLVVCMATTSSCTVRFSSYYSS